MGGVLVLGSYVVGLADAEVRGGLWGGVPERWRGLYTVNMFLAAAGYFPFTAYAVFAFDPARARVAGRSGADPFFWLYALVLLPSALWLPLTGRMLAEPSALLWWAIRLDLALVGVGSVGILATLLAVRPREPAWLWGLAVLGSLPFVLQTAVLDALVWPAFFPR